MAGGETAGAVNWYWVESSADYSLYIDTDTVKRNNGYVKVWSKYTYSDGHFDMVQYLFNTGYQRSGHYECQLRMTKTAIDIGIYPVCQQLQMGSCNSRISYWRLSTLFCKISRPQKKTVLGELSFVHPDQDRLIPDFCPPDSLKSVLQFLYRTKFSRY